MSVIPQVNSTNTDEYVVSVSRKGQITMPKEIRSKVRLKLKDKVAIRLEYSEAKVTPVKATFELMYQSVPALKRKLTDKEMAQIARGGLCTGGGKRGSITL
jgi:AbrB family looped-hinge helix DNA binding protein